MNKAQKYILLLTAGLLLLLVVFPPAKRFNTFSHQEQNFGHRPCWELGDFLEYDYPVMGMEALSVLLIGSILCLATKKDA